MLLDILVGALLSFNILLRALLFLNILIKAQLCLILIGALLLLFILVRTLFLLGSISLLLLGGILLIGDGIILLSCLSHDGLVQIELLFLLLGIGRVYTTLVIPKD